MPIDLDYFAQYAHVLRIHSEIKTGDTTMVYFRTPEIAVNKENKRNTEACESGLPIASRHTTS